MNGSLLHAFEVVDHSAELGATIRDALHAIAPLHGIPVRPAIPIVVGGLARGEGEYVFLSTVPNKPVRIVINRRATHPCMTLAHEIGHFMDNQVLHALKQGFASEYDEDFSPLIIGWEQTQMVKTLRRILSRHSTDIAASDRRYLRNLLMPQELWAATYAQWVATRTRHLPFERELEREIRLKGFVGRKAFTTQWEHEDFKRIMALVDELFRKRGLL